MLSDLIQYTEKNQATYASKGYRGLNVFGKVKFYQILRKNNKTLNQFYADALNKKECFIGPFIGEFGNFLLHLLPFISHLNENGVKVNYCGLELHRPFLVNSKGEHFLYNYVALRDFFKEVKPSENGIKNLPGDVQAEVDKFVTEARSGKLPFLDIYGDRDLYWYSYRNWQLNGKQHIYNLSQVYAPSGKQNKLVIFPRKMVKEFTPNNGGVWDYAELGEELTNCFDEVVFIGHPELSSFEEKKHDKIRYCVTGDNKDVLEECATARLILTQHSGAMHVGGFVHTPVLLIFKGDPPIKGLDDSIRFRQNFDYNKVNLVFNKEGILEFIIKLNS